MNKTAIAAAATALLVGACGTTEDKVPSSNVPGADIFLDAPDGQYHGQLMQLELRPAEVTIEVAQSQVFEAVGTFEDGTPLDIATHVAWASDAPSIAGLSETSVSGVAVGESTVKIQIGTLEATARINVVPASLVSIEITADTEMVPRRGAVRATAVGTFGDQHTEDITAMVNWTSSDESILSVGKTEKSAGRLTGITNGEATVTVEHDGISATRSFSVACVYPEAPSSVRNQQVIPAMSWTNAYLPGGGRGDFDMNDWFCNDESFGDQKALIFIVSSGWCPNCPAYLQRVNTVYNALLQAGAEVIIVEAEDANYNSANTEYAQSHLSGIIGTGMGIRVGDEDTSPSADFIRRSPIITAFPSAFVVRRSDMKVMANQSDSQYYLDFVDIMSKVDWDWSDPENPVPGFSAACEDDQEEQYEPNDSPQQAPVIQAAVVEGGVCNEEPDFYKIDIEGEWTVTLQFSNDVGNLDVYLWNEATNRPLRIGGELVGGVSDSNNEVFSSSGPRMLVVEGRDNASAPYTLFVEAH